MIFIMVLLILPANAKLGFVGIGVSDIDNSTKFYQDILGLGAPFSAPSSIKSKSNTRFSEAIITTTKLNPILISEPLVGFITENPAPKKLATNENKYTIAIPPVAANTPNLKFSVALNNSQSKK